jgi:hypothetical protein
MGSASVGVEHTSPKSCRAVAAQILEAWEAEPSAPTLLSLLSTFSHTYVEYEGDKTQNACQPPVLRVLTPRRLSTALVALFPLLIAFATVV